MLVAYWINKSGNDNRPNWRQFYCDDESDMDNLPTSFKDGMRQKIDTSAHKPCSIGSECLCIKTGKIVVLGSDDVWHDFIQGW